MKNIETPRTTFTFTSRRDGYVEACMIKEHKGREYEITNMFLYYTKKEIVAKLRHKMREEIKKSGK